MSSIDDEENLYSYIGVRVAAARRDAGMSQAHLANHLGISRVSIVNLECGRQQMPLSRLYGIATILGVEPKSFLPDRIPDAMPSLAEALDRIKELEAQLASSHDMQT